ncbi:MAG TPA: spermidine/putrescine ABC transporter substrate-binding protein [Streptosporangiaceae bacterium]|nr:spermidine/putrescine ABC transporter substrate-binding protein [Streptosporangiaceae bacterium]HVB42615.1 spermidine/putrescine ABC transporter substrate-binding protein [Streptosporangiaceae bacterium]
MTDGERPVDPALLRGMTRARAARLARPRRRDVLALGGLATAGVALAACTGSGGTKPAAVQAETAVERFWAGQKKHGHVNFANWPLYIDTGHKTLQEFTAATGITVSYAEVIQEDPYWVNKISPIIRARESIGYDLMVVTNGFWFAELLTQGELIPLDQGMLANFHSYAAAKFQRRSFDPGNTYSIPWASGTTGIAWNPQFIHTPITSINELWNPAYQGRVGMMADTQDLGNFGMLKLGIDPETSTPADWRAAAKVLTQQRAAGLVRGYYQQSYIDELTSGRTWISMAWSGDIFQQNLTSGTGLKFVIPDEGGTLWTDNMMIPKYAQNPVDAMLLMDWYYRPEIAAQLTESINYISAVPAAQRIIAAAAAKATGSARQTLQEVATSDLVWPTAAEYRRLVNYADVSGKLQAEYESVFNPVIAG